MAPYIVSTILLLLAAPGPQTTNPSNQLQTVSIVLPKGTKSETVQIRYMLSGPFGGYASYVDSKPDLRSYEINGAVQGQAAQTIRILVYASGCRFQTLVLAFSGKKSREEQFVCRPLPTIKLKRSRPSRVSKE